VNIQGQLSCACYCWRFVFTLLCCSGSVDCRAMWSLCSYVVGNSDLSGTIYMYL